MRYINLEQDSVVNKVAQLNDNEGAKATLSKRKRAEKMVVNG
jgi:hypothetical protein